MGTDALERPKVEKSTNAAPESEVDKAVKPEPPDLEHAAEEAVDTVQKAIEALGGTPEQGAAIREAMRLYLLRDPGYDVRARKVLAEVGFLNGNINEMLAIIDKSVVR